MTAYEALTKKYLLEASLAEMESRCTEIRESLPELKYRVREAQAARVESGGGFRRFLDRLSGKPEEDPETLDRAARAAEAALGTAQRELAVLEEKVQSAKKEWEALGDKAALMEELNETQRQHFLRLEASICAEAALHFLRKARKELLAGQELARNPMMTVGDKDRQNSHLANAGKLVEKCTEKLDEIKACGMELAYHPYLRNPMGYLVTAQRYAVLDRMNSALTGIRETESSLKEIILQLAQEG